MALATSTAYGIGTAMVFGAAALAATVGGLSIEGFLALIVAANGVELGLIVHNTASISRLRGQYDADHK